MKPSMHLLTLNNGTQLAFCDSALAILRQVEYGGTLKQIEFEDFKLRGSDTAYYGPSQASYTLLEKK